MANGIVHAADALSRALSGLFGGMLQGELLSGDIRTREAALGSARRAEEREQLVLPYKLSGISSELETKELERNRLRQQMTQEAGAYPWALKQAQTAAETSEYGLAHTKWLDEQTRSALVEIGKAGDNLDKIVAVTAKYPHLWPQIPAMQLYTKNLELALRLAGIDTTRLDKLRDDIGKAQTDAAAEAHKLMILAYGADPLKTGDVAGASVFFDWASKHEYNRMLVSRGLQKPEGLRFPPVPGEVQEKMKSLIGDEVYRQSPGLTWWSRSLEREARIGAGLGKAVEALQNGASWSEAVAVGLQAISQGEAPPSTPKPAAPTSPKTEAPVSVPWTTQEEMYREITKKSQQEGWLRPEIGTWLGTQAAIQEQRNKTAKSLYGLGYGGLTIQLQAVVNRTVDTLDRLRQQPRPSDAPTKHTVMFSWLAELAKIHGKPFGNLDPALQEKLVTLVKRELGL